MMDLVIFMEVLIIISKFEFFLKYHIDNAVLKNLKLHNDDDIARNISSNRSGSQVTLLSKTIANYIIKVT